MENTKNCPHCGKEILATAKKCKHCGEWLEKQCPYCGEWIKTEAKKCRYCGSWFNKWAKDKYEKETSFTSNRQSASPSLSTSKDIQEEITNHKEIENAGCLMNIECAVILGLLGFCYDWPFWGYFVAYLIGYILLSIRMLRILYCIGISGIWAVIGLALAPVLVDDSDWDTLSRMVTDDYADYWWMAAIFGIISLIFHWPAMKSRFNF